MQNFPVRSLQWDDIRIFFALARAGSLSAAARALEIEHSTVARRVDALERSLALRLFDRLPRGWQLTPEGEELAALAARMADEADAFGRLAQGAGSLRGSVRISAPPVFASHFLASRLGLLRRRWPGIHLELVGEAREANLARREADLALRLSRPSSPGLVARVVGELGYALYATPEWLQRAPEAWEFVGYDDSLRRVPQEQWVEAYAGARPFVLRANDLASLHQWARTGLGLALLPHFLGAADAALVRVPGAECPTRRKLWLVLHPDLKRSPRVRCVADGLVEILATEAALLAPPTPAD